jgi:hypothetical protein
MDNLDKTLTSILSELTILELEIKNSKAAQSAKYTLGKDQVNAMWNSIQSSGGIGLDEDSSRLISRSVEEDWDEVPSFVSRNTKEIRVGSSPLFLKPTDTVCSECGEKQFESPSGTTCSNGHGGALPLIDDEAGIKSFLIKGTFVKTGDPKPVTPIVSYDDDPEPVAVIVSEPDKPKFNITELTDSILNPTKKILIEDIEDIESPVVEPINVVEDIESILNEDVPLASTAPIKPRKKLMLLDDEDF